MHLFQVQLPVATGIAALAAIVFLLIRAREREREFTLIDSLMLVILMSLATVGGITLAEAASQNAKETALRENLRTFRTQIEAYKLQHGGTLPLLYQGTFPQLIEATNACGVPGPSGKQHPHGPYFRSGIPINPVTGQCVVTLTEENPPKTPSGNGGWLYHQKTGHLAADLAEHLAE